VTPEDAVAYAARILQDQLQLFVNFEERAAPMGGFDRPVRFAGEGEPASSTATCSRRWTSWSFRCVRPTA
jgi:DNA-directed RNA polymerase alpha subunit